MRKRLGQKLGEPEEDGANKETLTVETGMTREEARVTQEAFQERSPQ